MYSPIDRLKQKRIPWLDFNIVSFEALPPCPSAVLDRLPFHPRTLPWGLGANRAQWWNTCSGTYLSCNSNHLLCDTNSAINLFEPQVVGLPRYKMGIIKAYMGGAYTTNPNVISYSVQCLTHKCSVRISSYCCCIYKTLSPGFNSLWVNATMNFPTFQTPQSPTSGLLWTDDLTHFSQGVNGRQKGLLFTLPNAIFAFRRRGAALGLYCLLPYVGKHKARFHISSGISWRRLLVWR